MTLNSNSTEPIYNVASVKLGTEALGPYKRMAIWFQGCTFNCRGCCNPELQPLEPRNLVSLTELLDSAQKSKADNGIEGVTFIGGEPTLQRNLSVLAKGIKDLGLGILMFTGRDVEDLQKDLIEHLDLVIDGRFEVEDRDYERNLIGSHNQRIINLSGRYADHIDWFTKTRSDYIEVDILDDSFITNGSAF